MSSQTCGDGGSVAIMELFIGSQRLRSPGSRAVKPSVARRMTGPLSAPVVCRAARTDRGDRGLFVDGDPEAFDGLSQTAHQLRGLDPGALRVERTHCTEPTEHARRTRRR